MERDLELSLSAGLIGLLRRERLLLCLLLALLPLWWLSGQPAGALPRLVDWSTREPGIWLDFHRWSLPMLLAAIGLGWFLL